MKLPVKLQLCIGDQVIPFAKVVEVDMPKKALFIEEMKDGGLRLTYSRGLIQGEPLIRVEKAP